MQNALIKQAIEMAVENVHRGGGPFAALVVKDGIVIATGTNQVTRTNDPTAHAEIVAIRAACQALGSFHLEGCEIYSSCEPCPMCLSAMYWAKIRGYYYGNTRFEAAGIGFDDAHIYQEVAKPVEERLILGARLLAEEAAEAFAEWMRSAAKVTY